MKPDIISHPEEGRVYLVRARIGGSVQTRFKPAKITNVYTQDGVQRISVKFLYEGELEVTDLVFYDGLVKELSQKWLLEEYRAMNDRIVELSTGLVAVAELMKREDIR